MESSRINQGQQQQGPIKITRSCSKAQMKNAVYFALAPRTVFRSAV